MSIDTSKLNPTSELDSLFNGEFSSELEEVNNELMENGYNMVQELKKQQAEDWYRLANLTVGVNG